MTPLQPAKNRPSHSTLLLAALAVTLALHADAADAQVLPYSGTGLVAPLTDVVDGKQTLRASSDAGYTLGDRNGWSLSAPFEFNFATGRGIGRFEISRGVDGLFGDLGTRLVSDGPMTFELVYTVLGGRGGFAGFTGTGLTMVTITGAPGANGFPYIESGQLTLVPEPAAWALMLAGGALLALRRRSDRSASGHAWH